MNVTETTRTALRTLRGDWPEIAKSAGLSYWWLLKFAQGQIREPGATKLEKLRAVVMPRCEQQDTSHSEAA